MNSSSSTENFGQELVSNGRFDTSAAGWSLTGSAFYNSQSISIPAAGAAFKTISQQIPFLVGRSYLVEYTLTIVTSPITSSVLLGDAGVSHGNSNGRLSAILVPSSDGFLKISVETYGTGYATIDDISVKEFIQNSSDSTVSSFSSVSTSETSSRRSSLSSVIIKTSSSSESHSSASTDLSVSSVSSGSSISRSASSATTSGTEQTNESSKSSSVMDSSESSGQMCELDFPFSIYAYKEDPVWCFERDKDTVYAGTGPNGNILMSKDLQNWSVWNTVGDAHVRSIKVYANGLWIGTEPNGYVYVYNFTTDSLYPYLKTPDHAVTAMAVYNGELYVGTSPGGFVFSFDGTAWKRRKELYGNGITSMFVHGESMYISVKTGESIMRFDGITWDIIPSSGVSIPNDLVVKGDGLQQGSGMLTVAANRTVSTEPVSRDALKFIDRTEIGNLKKAVSSKAITPYDAFEVMPPLQGGQINTIGVSEGLLLIGKSDGTVIGYDGVFKTIHSNGDNEVVKIDKHGFFCTSNKLYYLKQANPI
jgi:hypothetical protein